MKRYWTKDSHKILERATKLNHYNKWLYLLFSKYLGRNILEIGSGMGGISQFFQAEKITLSDLRDDYFTYLKKLFGHKTIKLDIENETPKNLIKHFDTIFSSNVFEHIENDQAALNNSHKLLKKGGKLLLFAPARQEIFGSLDKALGHYRRYSKRELVDKVEKAGFKILDVKYANFPGYFTWWLRGISSGESVLDHLLEKAFDYLIVPIIYLEKYIPIPIGQSLILVAEKI